MAQRFSSLQKHPTQKVMEAGRRRSLSTHVLLLRKEPQIRCTVEEFVKNYRDNGEGLLV